MIYPSSVMAAHAMKVRGVPSSDSRGNLVEHRDVHFVRVPHTPRSCSRVKLREYRTLYVGLNLAALTTPNCFTPIGCSAGLTPLQ